MRTLHVATLIVLCAAGCAEPTFSAHRRDNNPHELAQALAKRAAVPPGPRNATGDAMVFVVTPRPVRLVAFDLTAGKTAWMVETDVTSRVIVGRDFVYHQTGERRIVARDARTGAEAWAYELPAGEHPLGMAADERNAYVVTYNDQGSRRVSTIWALRAGVVWSRETPGRLGAPAAAGGVVYVPFLSQYLALLDAENGSELARLRPGREQVTFARVLPEGVFYGDRGVYVLDARSASGRRDAVAYHEARLPEEFVRTFYYWDAYNEAQARYSAFDRNRLLWRCDVAGKDFDFRQALVVSTYRYLFAFAPDDGRLRWAHSYDGDIMASEHLGGSVAFVAANGEIVVLDPASGARLWSGRVDVPVVGATFDADGFAPAGAAARPAEPLAVALRRIVWDPDRRFTAVKVFAVDALTRLPGSDVSRELLKIVTHEGVAPAVYAKAGDALVRRKDAGAVKDLIEALKVRYSYVEGTEPRGLEVIARALAEIGTTEGMELLLDHLMDPETPLVAVREIAVAATRTRSQAAIAPLRDFLTTYRSDPDFSSDPAPMMAVVEGLIQIGGSKERQLLRFVADDPRTVERLRAYISAALEQTRQGSSTGSGKPAAAPAATKAETGAGKAPE